MEMRAVVILSLVFASMAATSQNVRAEGSPTATFSKDVAPIFQRSCQTCHRPNSIAPMSLLTFEDARPWAKAIKEKVITRNMPPWHIDRNVGISEFANNIGLTDQEIAAIVNWVDGGAPQGN